LNKIGIKHEYLSCKIGFECCIIFFNIRMIVKVIYTYIMKKVCTYFLKKVNILLIIVREKHRQEY